MIIMASTISVIINSRHYELSNNKQVIKLKLNGKNARHPAFTLIEAVIALSLLIVSAQLATASVQLLSQLTTLVTQQQQTIDWQISMTQLDYFLEDSYFIRQSRPGQADYLVFKKVNSTKTYYLKRVRNELVVVTQKEGYMPLIGAIKNVKLAYQDQTVIIKAVFKTGQTYQHQIHLEEQRET